MIPSQFEELVGWLEDRWPGTKNYKNWSKVAYDFLAIPFEAGMEAAENFYQTGAKMAPSIAELRAEGARIAAYKGLIDPTATSCEILGSHGALAIDELGDGKRQAQCVRCGTIWIKSSTELPTAGEVGAGLAGFRRVSPDMEQAQMDMNDRIAP